jgi:hypothetical protein
VPEKWLNWKAKFKRDNIDMDNISCLIDSLVLMANSDLLLKKMFQIDL